MDIVPKAPVISTEEIFIVLVGDFNPKIFHPMWFVHQNLLRESEAKEAQIEILHQDVTDFKIDWLTVQVLRDRFTAGIKADVYQTHLGDLVEGVFELLKHTPVRQLGINVTFRMNFRSEEDWHAFGHYLTPKSPWDNVISKPGLRAVHIQGQRDKSPGYVVVAVEPDLGTRSDAIVRINDHFEMPVARETVDQYIPVNALWAVDILHNGYNSSIERAKQISEQLITNFTKTKTVDTGKSA